MRGFIYQIKNLSSGKLYIGQTIKANPIDRVREHFVSYKKVKTAIHLAIKKYGETNFSYEILLCCLTQEDLDFYERHFISSFNTLAPRGYNLRTGGKEGVMCAASKQKLSESLKGKKKSESHRNRMSEVRRGFTSTARKESWLKITSRLSKPVLATHIETQDQLVFGSAEGAARGVGGSASCVVRVCNGTQGRTQHKGWKFEYLRECTDA